MAKKLSVSDIEYICSQWLQKAPECLAEEIKKPVKLVKALVELIEEPKKEKKHSARAQADDRQRQRKVRYNQSIYETKPLDLTDKVQYKLNSKTTVWAKPGIDIGKLKKKYNIK
jgi:hypothetical protein